MTVPHEYRNEYGEWNLHSYHNSELYEDPDYIASDADYQLPLLSTLGRGPRGDSVTVKEIEDEDGYRLAFINDSTNETILETPNLAPGTFSITWPSHNWQEGEVGWMTVTYRKGSEVIAYDVPIPPGSHGSRMYLSTYVFEEREDKTYVTNTTDLCHYGRDEYKHKPDPRPGDIVVFEYQSTEIDKKIAFGTIEAVEDNAVVFTSRTEIAIPIPQISDNGTWVIDGTDTGMPTRGEDGRDARIAIGNVETLPPDHPASISESYDVETNTTTLNFGIPEGPVGKTVEIRGGIWTVDTLPDFETTPINDAFVVRDDDKQFDLYVRGQEPSIILEDAPWTVVEDWQGRPGTGIHIVKEPYRLSNIVGNEVSVPASEASMAFHPSDYLTDGDVLMDEGGRLGILGSAEDGSGDYTMITTASMTVDVTVPDPNWSDIDNKPFEEIGNGLNVSNGVLNVEASAWNDVSDKPFDTIGEGLAVDDDGSLMADISWNDVSSKPTSFASTWTKVTGKPFSTIGDGLVVSGTTLKVDPSMIGSSDTDWESVTNKPFNSVGNGLIVNDDALEIDESLLNQGGEYSYRDNGISDAGYSIYQDGEFGMDIYVPLSTTRITFFPYNQAGYLILKTSNTRIPMFDSTDDGSPLYDKANNVVGNYYISTDSSQGYQRFSVTLKPGNIPSYVTINCYNGNKLQCFELYTIANSDSQSTDIPDIATVDETKAYLGIQ